jgi:RimJ/RimL family protein N-acetyltransferase
MFLQSDTIYLRALSIDDVTAEYLSWLNNNDVTAGLVAGTFPSTFQDLQQYINAKAQDKNTVIFAICDKHTHKHIGNIKIDNFDWISKTCELGILIGNKDFWGKGIGTEACKLVIDYAFNTLNIRKILLAVYSTNVSAIKVYERLGFEKEGTLKAHVFQHGNYIDKHYMSIFNNEKK